MGGGALPETTLADPKKKRRRKKKKQSEDDDDATTGGDSLDTSLDGLEEKDGGGLPSSPKSPKNKKKDGGGPSSPKNKKKKGNQNLVNLYFVYEDLDPGLMYRIRLSGVSSVGQGKWCPATFSTQTQPTRPNKPDPPTVDPDSIGMRSMKVMWVAPHDNGSATNRFILRMREAGLIFRFNMNFTRAELHKLEPGCSYSFEVCAANQQGTSDWSDPSEAVLTKPSLTEAPAQPLPVGATLRSITIRVERPYDNGSPITAFRVERREISMYHKASWGNALELAITPIEPRDRNPPPCSLTIDGLLAETTYDFRVAAINEHGPSEWSIASNRSRTLPPMTPALMDTPRIDGVFPTSVVLVWEAPDDNGAKIMGYKVEIEKVGGLVDLDDGKGKGKKSSKNAVKKQLTEEEEHQASIAAAAKAAEEAEAAAAFS